MREEFDIILMDVQMPVMDGIQATSRIRAMPPPKRDIPIIALTADALRGAEDTLSRRRDGRLPEQAAVGEGAVRGAERG